jgi:hypothetical protein
LQQGSATQASHGGVSSALPGGSAPVREVRFPGEDGGSSLGEMAQRDLDAALQLLADRAQYITGSTGVAIALRRGGKSDMLCRASSGSNAPELGTLLSTEFGLSGESVRTRQLLRCDDAERDARVNHEVCRELGIASVAVMPVVNDDEVLGVFELFSGKANAFGERDFAALKRLSEMVETAVKLARAAEELPERLKIEAPSTLAEAKIAGQPAKTAEAQAVSYEACENRSSLAKVEFDLSCRKTELQPDATEPAPVAMDLAPSTSPTPQAFVAPPPAAQDPEPPVTSPLFWSAPADDALPLEPEQNHLPPALRSLRKCEACGFPVSAGRSLCVECEEKKWRGQLKPRALATSSSSGAAAAPALAPEQPKPPEVSPPFPEERKSIPPVLSANPASASLPAPQSPEPAVSQSSPAFRSEAPAPELILSAGLEPSQSWLARNKLMILVLAALAISAAAVVFLH